MSLHVFDAGDQIDLTASFATNPDTVDIAILKPDGTTTTPTPSSPSTGVYTTSVVPVLGEHGTWWWTAHGTGNVQARGERKFKVRKPHVT